MLTSSVLLNRTVGLSPGERMRLEAAVSGTQDYRAGQVAVHQGQAVDVSLLLVEGFMSRRVDTRDGKRHLVAVHVPGDFVDLHAFTLKRLDHDVGALTDVKVAIFPHASLERIQMSDVELTKRLWFITMLDAAMHRQWICRLAGLNALQRVAHFVCETNARLLAIGLSTGKNFVLPMNQSEIGEVCSLTNVHVNRVLRELREMNVCLFRSTKVDILDLERLVDMAAFEPGYLYLNELSAARSTAQGV
jgi:CRP-like cAMP-binding protein